MNFIKYLSVLAMLASSLEAFVKVPVTSTTHSFTELQEKIIQNPTKLLKKIEKSALSALHECSNCSLARKKSDGERQREAYDQKVSTQVANLSKNNHSYNYVSFASGDLFTDARILTLARKKGAAALNVHIIDIKYQGRTASHKVFKQFAEYLSHLFGAENVTLSVYESAQDYCSAVQQQHTTQPDIIVGADFPRSEQARMLQHLSLIKTQTAKPTTTEVLLLKH